MNRSLEPLPIGSDYLSVIPTHPIPDTIPEKMKAWVIYKGGKTQIEEMPVPSMLPDDVLIEPLWISICASDVNKFRDLVGDLQKTVFGHEFAGRVVAVGKNVESDLIGQAVVVEEHYPCLQCDPCSQGRYDKCVHEGFLGWYKSGNPKDWVRNGAFGEYVSIHHSCAKPTGKLERLNFFPSLAEPFGNTVKMERIVREECGGVPDTLIIWGGCGAQAQYMVPYFVTTGVKNFVLIYRGKPAMLYMKNITADLEAQFHFVHSDDDQRLRQLKNELGQQEGFISIELTGHEAIQEKVLKYASPHGKVFYYGLPGGTQKVMIPKTETDLFSFITGKAGVEKLDISGVSGVRVMGRDNESWETTLKVLKKDKALRTAVMKPFVLAGTTTDLGSLIEYLMKNGVRYDQEPYGLRPAKFGLLSEKMIKN